MTKKKPKARDESAMREFRRAALDVALETAGRARRVIPDAKVFERYLATGYVPALGGCSKRPQLERALLAARMEDDDVEAETVVALAEAFDRYEVTGR